jgi:hypothetical protein
VIVRPAKIKRKPGFRLLPLLRYQNFSSALLFIILRKPRLKTNAFGNQSLLIFLNFIAKGHISMKAQTYLNIVLTVIALNLSILSLSVLDVLPQATATNQPQQQLSIPVNEDGSVDVRLQPSDQLNVTIEDVDRGAFRYTDIPVKIEDQPIEVEQY